MPIGDLDLASAVDLDHVLRRALSTCPPTGNPVVDLAEVTFLDSARLGPLLTARRLAAPVADDTVEARP